MKKILLLLFPLCGIAAAQTFTGEHYTGSTCPESPNGENGCNYGGNITGDPYAAYASITDTTGANFPAYYPRWTPPTIDAENTPWNATITWQNGAQVTGTITVTNGTCTTKGAPVPTRTPPFAVSPVVYTVTCSGIDSNGKLASKTHIYRVYFGTGRGGGFWQPPQDGTGTTTFTAIGAAPAVTAVPVTLTSSPSGVDLTLAGSGCSPGNYTTPATTAWVPQSSCTVTFADPQIVGGVHYAFHSSTVNGSATSHQNPLTINSGALPLTINANYTAISGAGPGQTTHLSVTAPAATAAGVPFQFTVTALTSGNTTDATYTDPVHFTSTDPSVTLPGDMTLTNGVATFSASLATVGMQTLTASDLFSASITGTSAGISVSAPSGLRFVPVTPCRVLDTRGPAGPFGAPYIGPTGADGQTRSFAIPNSSCPIPATAQSYSFNVTVVPHGPLGYVTVWPCGQPQPLVSTLNSLDGRVKADALIVPAGTGGAICIYSTNDTDFILDINGYFVPAVTPNALAFYPVTPCRLVDTRVNLLTSGALTGGESRTLPILSSSCNVPATAQAYSLNFTVVPAGQVGYLSAWPTRQSQPLVSTLNDPTGTVVANAAIVPAGTAGDIDVYATDTTDLVVDINGYFAPAGTGGLSLYNLPPCRVLDTRNPSGSLPFTGQLDVNVIGSGCGGTRAAQGYVLNATVVPPGPLGFLTLWPHGAAQPLVSTLNALDGAITNNMAIVLTSDTDISAYASGPTHLILDMSGYFAP